MNRRDASILTERECNLAGSGGGAPTNTTRSPFNSQDNNVVRVIGHQDFDFVFVYNQLFAQTRASLCSPVLLVPGVLITCQVISRSKQFKCVRDFQQSHVCLVGRTFQGLDTSVWVEEPNRSSCRLSDFFENSGKIFNACCVRKLLQPYFDIDTEVLTNRFDAVEVVVAVEMVSYVSGHVLTLYYLSV